MSIEITHTADEGTLVHGTTRGDGTNTILKAAGFRWFRTLGLWGIAGSRDRQPNRYKIERAAESLHAAGHTVSVDIDDNHRPTAEAEANRAQRQAQRADALAAKADRKADAADAACDAEQRAVDALPPGGEPIKIGHHSERRHRNAIDRAHDATHRAIEATTTAQHAAARAEAAAATTARRHKPVTVKNRIDKLEAEQRSDQRILDGHRRVVARTATHEYVDEFEPAAGPYRDQVTARMDQREDEIAYWTNIYATQPAASPALTAATPSPKAISSSTEGAGTRSSAPTPKPSLSICTTPPSPTRSATTKSPVTGQQQCLRPPRVTTASIQGTSGPGQLPPNEGWPGPFFLWLRWRRRAPRDHPTGHLSGARNPQPLTFCSRQLGAHGNRAGARPRNPRPHRNYAGPVTFWPDASSPKGATAPASAGRNPAPSGADSSGLRVHPHPLTRTPALTGANKSPS